MIGTGRIAPENRNCGKQSMGSAIVACAGPATAAEVTHYGDPGFDTGFLLTHLALKAIHRPEHRDGGEAPETTPPPRTPPASGRIRKLPGFATPRPGVVVKAVSDQQSQALPI